MEVKFLENIEILKNRKNIFFFEKFFFEVFRILQIQHVCDKMI